MLNPDEFAVVEQGASPLRYNRMPGMPRQRMALVHPDLQVPDPVNRRSYNAETVQDIEYFAPQAYVGRGLNNRKLKTPKLVNNPSAAAPGTGAFADFVDMERDASPEEQPDVYVDYVTRRNDLSGLGAADRLIRAIANTRPNARIDLGRVMSPRVWSAGEGLRSEGRDVQMRRDF